MPIITWSDNLSVGIVSIDDQHKEIVRLINDLFDAMKEGKGSGALGGILDDLAGYTVKHFAYEEALFNKHDYPARDEHKASHDALVKQVLDLKEGLEAGKATITKEVMDFLKDWLSTHICGEDKKYTAFLIEKGVT